MSGKPRTLVNINTEEKVTEEELLQGMGKEEAEWHPVKTSDVEVAGRFKHE